MVYFNPQTRSGGKPIKLVGNRAALPINSPPTYPFPIIPVVCGGLSLGGS
jgi:hypothetical protein